VRVEHARTPQSGRSLTPHTRRTVKFSGTGVVAAATYAAQASALVVTIDGAGADFWYLPAIRECFVPDPAQWDAAYAAGVRRIDSFLRDPKQHWDLGHIAERFTR